MIKVVFIDIDNTLLSFSGYVKEAMRDGFCYYGLKPYNEDMFPVFEIINNSLWRQVEQGTLTFEELIKCRWNLILRALGIDFDGEEFESYFRKKLFNNAVPEEGAIDLLKYLSGKYLVCAASNGPYEQQVNRLRVGNMIDYFTHCFISSKVGAQKPSRQFFEYCFDVLRKNNYPDLLPDEAIMIGDSVTSDIKGGLDYGMHTCFYKKHKKSEITDSGAEYEVDSLSEIKNIL